MNQLSRRSLLLSAPVAAVSLAAGEAIARAARAHQPASKPITGDDHRGPVCVASLNGLPSVARAMELMRQGFDPADCVVQGVRIVEDDPNDDSVGYGGLPNADGVVELDASVMHGPTHKSGAVASIRNIKNPAQVALMVLRRTDHCLLVGEGALRFARSMGFREEDLLTERARKEWLAWRENMSRDDDWLNDVEKDDPSGKTWDRLPWEDAQAAPAQDPNAPRRNDGPLFQRDRIEPPPGAAPIEGGPPKKSAQRPYIMEVTGTIHCGILDASTNIASCTTTSGLNWKIPGRVGDSPIIGAGNYCDNDIGAAGSTGRGEANLVTLASARIVDFMASGLTPNQACLRMCQYIVDRTKEKRLKGPDGRPTFDLKFYALRKDGAFGAASLYSGGQYAVHDGKEARVIEAPYVFERKTP